MNHPGPSPPHGFALSAADRDLLRAPPPACALDWAAAAIGPGARILSLRALEGGTSSAVHALDVGDSGDGSTHALVLRRFVRADWLAEEPEAPAREAAALEVARGCAVPTPRLVALDGRGEHADVPALLMTRVQGHIEWRPLDLETFLAGLAGALQQIHATRLPSGAPIPLFAPYEPHPLSPPPWAVRPALWRTAIAVFEGPAPIGARVFLHRDFHPGNVLWIDGTISGVVDWVNASVGPPQADVGHCRANLAGRFGQAAADRFLDLYRDRSGLMDYEPYWDVVAALGGLGRSYLSDPSPQDEGFLAAALARG